MRTIEARLEGAMIISVRIANAYISATRDGRPRRPAAAQTPAGLHACVAGRSHRMLAMGNGVHRLQYGPVWLPTISAQIPVRFLKMTSPSAQPADVPGQWVGGILDDFVRQNKWASFLGGLVADADSALPRGVWASQGAPAHNQAACAGTCTR